MHSINDSSKLRLATPEEARKIRLNQPARSYAQMVAQVEALKAARRKSSAEQSKKGV